MPLNLKVAWGAGAFSARLMGLDDATTLGDLKALVASKSGMEAHCMQLKAGFPPRDVSGSETDPVVQLGITSGSAVTVLEQKGLSAPAAPAAPAPAAGAALTTEMPPLPLTAPTPTPSVSAPPDVPASTMAEPPQEQHTQWPEMVQSLVDMGFSREYAARALEATGGDIHTALEMCMGGDPAAFMSDEGETAAPTTMRRIMVRRIIDADNSCLFNAVGYALRRKRKVGAELRQMITEAVRANPKVYNEGILGKQPEEYCTWISHPKSWGGEIELSILSKKLVVMITVVDIQTNNAYSYGENQGFERRVFLIYDGVHYDALAEAVSDTASEADDVTTFDPEISEKVDMAKAVAADLKARNQFTNMGNADLKCMVCLKLLAGQNGALEHARATGHQNFGQI